MKKSVLLLGISLFALTACNNSPVESIYSIPVEINKIRPYKNESSASIVMLKSALDLKTKVSMSKATDFDFVLFVTKFQCQGCADMRNLIVEYTKENPVVFYTISSTTFNELSNEDSSTYPLVTSTPTLYFYSKGKVVDSLIGAPTYSKFKYTLDTYFKKSNIICLNDLENKYLESENYNYQIENNETTFSLDLDIANKNQVSIFYLWNSCSDCQSLMKNYLIPYSYSNPEKLIYIYDVSEIRDKVEPGNEYEIIWKAFKEKYGLTNYLSGYVPSLVTYKNGVYSSLIVYHNEGEIIENSDNSYSYSFAQLEEVRNLKSSSKEELRKQSEEIEFNKMIANL